MQILVPLPTRRRGQPGEHNPKGAEMPDDAGQTGGKGDADQTGEKTYTQKELDDKIAAVRKGVEDSISKKFADYDDLKAKADQLGQLEESKKSDEQKLLDRIAALEKADADKAKALEQSQVDRLRERVAAKRSLTDAQAARLQGSSIEELEKDATELFGEPKEPDPEPTGKVSRQPRPDLKGGSDPTDTKVGEADVQKVFDDFEL